MQDKINAFVSEWDRVNDEQKMKMFNGLSFKEEDSENSKFALAVYKFIMKDVMRLLNGYNRKRNE